MKVTFWSYKLAHSESLFPMFPWTMEIFGKHLQYRFDGYARRYPRNMTLFYLCPPARMAQRAPRYQQVSHILRDTALELL